MAPKNCFLVHFKTMVLKVSATGMGMPKGHRLVGLGDDPFVAYGANNDWL